MRLPRDQQILQPGNGVVAPDEARESGGQIVLVRCGDLERPDAHPG